MTIYICQCPHRGNAKIWTAPSEARAIEYLEDTYGESFDSISEAVTYDHRIGYYTDDPLDLLMWVSFDERALATRAKTTFLKSLDLRLDVEILARREIVDGEIIYKAFDDRFTWSVETDTWTIDNQEPAEAENLFEAMCEAYIRLNLAKSMGQHDV